MATNKRLIKSNDEAATASFNTVLYTGNSSTQSITGVGFQPDLVWIKRRNTTEDHALFDSVRGALKQISTNLTAAEYTTAAPFEAVSSFDSDGFTTGDNGATNRSPNTYVAWCWKAGGAAVSNTDGTITSQVSANQDAGFSIVKFTSNGSSPTVGHGLSSAPELVIWKNIDASENWWVQYNFVDGSDDYLILNLTDSKRDASAGWQGSLTSTTIKDFTTATNGQNVIAYCFHSVDGYQKVGSYEGGTLNTTITTGFQPRFVMLKNVDDAYGWAMFDSVRGVNGSNDSYLAANDNAAEANVGSRIEFLSTGFQLTTTNINYNGSGDTYIYLAIA